MNKQVIEFFAKHEQDTVFEALGYLFTEFEKAELFIGGTTGTVATYTRAQVEQFVAAQNETAAPVAETAAVVVDETPAVVVDETPAPVVDETPAVVVDETAKIAAAAKKGNKQNGKRK